MGYGKTLAMTSDGDLLIARKRLHIIEGTDKVAQDLQVLLRSAVGSSPFNPRWGTNVQALVSGTDREIAAEVRTAIRQYPHAQAIKSIQVTRDPDTRTATIQVEVTTPTGDAVQVMI